MIRNDERIGSFTSSKIGDLMTNGRKQGELGAPAKTYIAEKNMERRLQRSINTESNARPLSWGLLLEQHVFGILGLEYQLVSQQTIVHPEYHFWAGSPDANKFDEGGTVVDIKAPITLKSFCQLVDPIYDGLEGLEAMAAVRKNHKSGDNYYWQLVSNGILTGSKYAELIVYAPYKSELDIIRNFANEHEIQNEDKYYWISRAADDELPYLPDSGFYKNINIIRFEIPTEDIEALTERVVEASKLLR